MAHPHQTKRSGKIYTYLTSSFSRETSNAKKSMYKKLYKGVITVKAKSMFEGTRVDKYLLYGRERK